ncbi:MAG TPA: DUF5995 family protein [Pyrinomonadaceae bacterium]|nr:DUF5995 family protein [Pyrinomonadaceae bacterium]
MSANLNDEALASLINAGVPQTMDDVIGLMQQIDDLLPSSDGLKWFNLLYLLVTSRVHDHPPPGGFADVRYLAHLDVVFANLYFNAIGKLGTRPQAVPSAWKALLEVRHRADIDRIQFAIAGMNAHINHDLPIALVQANNDFGIEPDLNSPQHDDFEKINLILEVALPQALEFLATGLLGEIAQDSGKIGRLLALWSVRKARDNGWNNSVVLKNIENIPFIRKSFLASLDKITGALGRTLLLAFR